MRNFSFGTTSNPSLAGCALSALAALTLLAGCAGGSSTPRLPSVAGQNAAFTQSHMSGASHPEIASLPGMFANAMQGRTQQPRSHAISRMGPNVVFPANGIVWVTDAGNNSVYRCTNVPSGCVAQQVTPFGTPPLAWNEPQGIAADAQKNVYIADTLNSRIVELNSAGGLVTIYADPGELPVGVGVAIKPGTICVTNIFNTSYTQGNIVCYKHGHIAGPNWTTCCALTRYYFGGFDKDGNFYADGFDVNNNVVVEEVAAAATGGTVEANSGISNVSFPGGIEVGRTNGGLLDVDDQLAPGIRQYTLPLYGAGTPAFIPLTGSSDPVSFGFKPGDLNIWTADAGLAEANEYGDPLGALHFSLPSGTAQTGIFVQPIGAVYTAYGQY